MVRNYMKKRNPIYGNNNHGRQPLFSLNLHITFPSTYPTNLIILLT
jgi:hypothetical protein